VRSLTKVDRRDLRLKRGWSQRLKATGWKGLALSWSESEILRYWDTQILGYSDIATWGALLALSLAGMLGGDVSRYQFNYVCMRKPWGKAHCSRSHSSSSLVLDSVRVNCEYFPNWMHLGAYLYTAPWQFDPGDLRVYALEGWCENPGESKIWCIIPVHKIATNPLRR